MEVIQMRDGPLIRQDALLLALRLEEQGHQMTVANGVLTVTHGSRLSAEDRAAIGGCKLHLRALIGYCQEGHEAR